MEKFEIDNGAALPAISEEKSDYAPITQSE